MRFDTNSEYTSSNGSSENIPTTKHTRAEHEKAAAAAAKKKKKKEDEIAIGWMVDDGANESIMYIRLVYIYTHDTHRAFHTHIQCELIDTDCW